MIAAPRKASTLAAAGGVAAACALVAVFGLVSLAKPRGFDARLATVQADADLAARLLRQKGVGRSYPANAICASATDAGLEALQAELTGLAALMRLKPTRIDVSLAPGLPTGNLVPLEVRFEVSGSYDAALGALERLAEVRPLLLIDTVDLSSRTSFVTLAVSGRAFCSAPQ